MRRILCTLLAIALLGFSNTTLAQIRGAVRADDGAPKASDTEFPKGVKTYCGRFDITLKTGETLKNVKVCSTDADSRIRIVEKGKVLMIAKSEISDQQYRVTFWEKFKDGVRIALIIPAVPVLFLMFWICNRGPMRAEG